MRQDDPVYDQDDAYIPSSIQVLHLWCDPDDELPWETYKTYEVQVLASKNSRMA